MTENTDRSVRRSALDRIEKIVGSDRIHRTDDGGPLAPEANASMFAARETWAVLRPRSVDEVRSVVREFERSAELPALHAVSTGHNWGLGSKEPATGPVVRIELDGLDDLRALDTEAGYAVVEPGVTQRRLSTQLSGTTRMLNVTASSGHTSVVGNILDRGVGLRRQRTDDLLGLEAVLPDGRLVRLGWWPDSGAGKAFNRYGVGPSLLHLFTQSPFAVVTAAVVRLLPRPESQQVVRLSFPRENLSAAVEQLRHWRACGVVSGVVKVYDTTSTASYGGQDGHGYLAHLSVDGTRRSTPALVDALVAEAQESGLFTGVSANEEPADDDVVSHVVRSAYQGSVAHNERMLASATGERAERVDSDGGGWLFFLPLIPFTGRDTLRALSILDRIHAATGVRPGATVNALDADVVDLVVSFRFARTEERTRAAHRALDLAYQWFTEAGYAPYRIDSDHHGWAERTSADPETARLIRDLRSLFDPNGSIASGRYV